LRWLNPHVNAPSAAGDDKHDGSRGSNARPVRGALFRPAFTRSSSPWGAGSRAINRRVASAEPESTWGPVPEVEL
jgi:hypothetical protein